MSSPIAPGLTSPWALHSRVLQASSTWTASSSTSSSQNILLVASGSSLWCAKQSSKYSWLLRGCEVLKPRNLDHIWCVKDSHSIWSSPRALGWIAEFGCGSLQSFSSSIFQKIWKINLWCHISRSPRALNRNPVSCGSSRAKIWN